MDEIARFIQKDLFAKHLGIEIIEFSEGMAKAKLEIKEKHLNSVGVVHGGVIFSLADAAFEIASNTHGTVAMSINVTISYFTSVKKGILFAEAREVSLNPKLATYLIYIKDDEDNTLAVFQGTVYRKKDRIADILD